jgi:hypothetical protein
VPHVCGGGNAFPPEHLSSPLVLSGVRFALFLVFCVMFCRFVFDLWPFSFCLCIACPSLIYHIFFLTPELMISLYFQVERDKIIQIISTEFKQ